MRKAHLTRSKSKTGPRHASVARSVRGYPWRLLRFPSGHLRQAFIVLAVAIVGYAALTITRADTSTGAAQAVKGALSGGASIVADAGASGGKAVIFHTASSGGSGGGGGGSTGGGGSSGGGSSGGGSSTPPATRLGIWQAAEDNGSFSTVSGQKPDVANVYLGWQNSWPSQFISGAEAAGATPFVELEPWNSSQQPASFSSIDSGTYDSWLNSIGSSVKSLGKPVIFTFAHEFNIGGQYPWSIGPPGSSSCGSNPCSPSQWIQAWDHVEAAVNKTAGGHAFWMWCPNVDSGGSNTNPAAWWPGTSEVQMVGVDGYPSFINSSGGTFQSDFGQTFSEIHSKTNLPIFIAETDLSPLGSGGYESITNYIKDMAADGGDGILQFQEGLPALKSSQWSELDAALAQYVK